MPSNVSGLLFIGIWMLAIVSIIVKTVKNKCSPIKTAKAIVVDKQKVENFSKYSGNGKHEKYVVIFSAEGKKLSFYVSQFSYDGYKINEKGILKYRGNRIIEFN